jgi:serine/threonine-protein kinase
MSRDDPTTPLDGFASHEQPTIARVGQATGGTVGFTPGSVVAGRYRIVSLLGRGGMGEVYRADDLRLGQPAALKFITVADVEPLYHEVRLSRQVTHPNVCRVHDVVEADGLRFIAMEYVDGEDLAALLRRVGRLPAAKATQVAREIAAGLAAAHERGIVHRDLKPGNVMIDGSGRARVTDFGLASRAGAGAGTISGTPAYMAPEQVAGGAATARSDVYSLGLVLYELFTGERVYDTPSYAERRAQRTRTPRPPSALVPEVESVIDRVIESCLAADPQQRPPSAREVLAMLPAGDAIDAALAAGETPSPEMVAAAAETGVLPARVAWALFAAIVIALPFIAWQSEWFLYSLARKPREVLADRAAAVVAAAGMTTPARDEATLFTQDVELLRTRPRPFIQAARPGIIHFVYRRSPGRMSARSVSDTIAASFIYQTGRISFTDPPLEREGDAAVILDQNAALVEYRGWPGHNDPRTDWKALLESTGVDLATLREAVPEETPPVPTDGRRAWTATSPPVRIEAATLDGRPVWLAVRGSWHRPRVPLLETRGRVIFATVELIIALAMTAGAFYFVRRNLHRGSSDRRGGWRLACFAFAVLFLSWLLAAHHSSNPADETRLLALGIGGPLASAGIIWCLYTAIEPSVRRRWPRALIGWTRLLAGRTRDPMVGRDLLLGMAGSIVYFQIMWLSNRLPAAQPYVHAYTLDPLPRFLADKLLSAFDAIAISIACFFIYLVFRAVLRHPAAAAAAWLLLVAGTYFVVPSAPFFMVLILIVLLRFGLLAAVAMNFVQSVLFFAPLTLDTTAWFFPRGLCVMATVAATAWWAARRATGR